MYNMYNIVLMLGYIGKAWEICNRFIIMVIQWAWESIFNYTFKQTGLNIFFSLEYFCFGAGRTRNKLFLFHYALFPWTLNWRLECLVLCQITFQWLFAALGLSWKAITVYPCLQPFYSQLKATAELFEHYTLSWAALIYAFIHFCSTSSLSSLVL